MRLGSRDRHAETVVLAALALSWPCIAAADEAVGTKLDDTSDRAEESSDKGASSPARQNAAAQSGQPKKEDSDDPDETKLTIGGYVETFYQWNFNRPSNGITNYRAYDDRHDTFTIQNAVVDTGFHSHEILGRLTLQIGHAAAAMYQQEPQVNGTDGANAADGRLWQYIQRAVIGYAPWKPLLLEAGIISPSSGMESLAVKDNWNWSRTFAFNRLPTYETGVKATVHASDRWDISGGIINGWNSVVDNNEEKSFFVQGQYKAKDDLTAAASYTGGVERSAGAPEGPAWRHMIQSYAQWDVRDWLELGAEGDGGFEDNRFGFHWFAAAVSAIRFKTTHWLYLALRGERLWEDPSANAFGQASSFIIPTKHVTSATATIDVRPVKGLSTRLELRHDRAASDVFFRGSVEGEGTPDKPYMPNSTRQTTLLLGVVAWFE